MWPPGNIAPTFYPLLYALLATKTYDYGQYFRFYHKMKSKAATKTAKTLVNLS